MKISTVTFISSIAISTTLLWIICSLFVAISPELSAVVTEQMMHMESGQISFQMSWQGFLIGWFSWVVSAVFAGWLLSIFYNKLRSDEKQ